MIPHSGNKLLVLKILLLSSSVVFFLFLLQGRTGFNLADEGFLWYGVQRVMVGEVPIRDFMAYDPGRYYWSAFLMSAMGDDGILSLRISIAIFQAFGLFVGLLIIAQSEKYHGKFDFIFWTISVVTLVIWMFPRHKLFDISLSIFLFGILTYLVNKPMLKNYFITGLCVGLVATFGRNHGVYGATGSIGVMLWLGLTRTSDSHFLKSILYWGAGVAIGFLPVILMLIFIPGFSMAFWEGIHYLIETKATNLFLPITWPWAVNFSARPLGNEIRRLFIGFYFMGTVFFCMISFIWMMVKKWKGDPVPPTLVVSTFLTLPYVHYAFSRADMAHLSQSIFPFLLGCLTVSAGRKTMAKWSFSLIICAVSVWTMYAYQPFWQFHKANNWKEVVISGDRLQVDSNTAMCIELLRQLADQYAPHGRSFIAAPFCPGAYALLNRRSPMRDIYPIKQRGESFQKKELDRIELLNPGFALVVDLPLDGRNDLRFKNTHRLINEYILNNFDPVPYSHNPAYKIFKARMGNQ